MDDSDRYHGRIAGLAIGDALGHPTEFVGSVRVSANAGVSVASWASSRRVGIRGHVHGRHADEHRRRGGSGAGRRRRP